ncbi:hypothetical protein DDB_G0293256 [Dictyostelium discoideum AX4]|uniref:Putative uncharacterized protein DDB_G0293256 n=1 Tax=Dictyostelium discoideum TaxID=44689 RepID=Y1854_DICDI|nr:hypothetical protein DDB_G0293256 [Dictyostelium discoideum AX4]Q54C51.1 RecName: Full=Putative uncharacterized protein DDB_G0293256 [Dictyostelium discoideum]EAL60827.1 hypothetical protein DDB_G0293256 [Dictyostelium discoideum AX4]|eukprot:XP_629215.1 hypothetical protein DDB_G0293256 [Dictyostelium discoideum AX4]
MTMINSIINISLNKISKTHQINKFKNENNFYNNNLKCSDLDVDFRHQTIIGNIHLGNKGILAGIYYNI